MSALRSPPHHHTPTHFSIHDSQPYCRVGSVLRRCQHGARRSSQTTTQTLTRTSSISGKSRFSL
eukprot:12627448-Prorocentrum_lima.AAC.1